MRVRAIGSGLAKVGALGLALGALGFFVVTAQRNAGGRTKDAPEVDQRNSYAPRDVLGGVAPIAEDGATAAPESDASPEAVFLPSSKVLVLDGTSSLQPADDTVFLFGSKSGVLTTEPLLFPPAPDSSSVDEAQPEPVFLPTSKSAPPLIDRSTAEAKTPNTP